MIVVTGASSGLGLAISDRLAQAGNEIYRVSRSFDGAPNAGKSCDVGDANQVKELTKALKATEKPITGLVNAAGIASMNLALMTPAGISERIIRTNLLGTILVNQAVAPLMIKSKAGSIINFSTIAAAIGLEGESIYAASKAGVESFSNTFAKEVSALGLRVNVIAPGPIDTNLISKIAPEKINRVVARQVIKRKFCPDDICNVVDYLLSDESSSLSGQIFHIGGV